MSLGEKFRILFKGGFLFFGVILDSNICCSKAFTVLYFRRKEKEVRGICSCWRWRGVFRLGRVRFF